jgi:hypothetical protein
MEMKPETPARFSPPRSRLKNKLIVDGRHVAGRHAVDYHIYSDLPMMQGYEVICVV